MDMISKSSIFKIWKLTGVYFIKSLLYTKHDKNDKNKVEAKLVAKHNEEHSPVPDMTEVCKWFEKYLH